MDIKCKVIFSAPFCVSFEYKPLDLRKQLKRPPNQINACNMARLLVVIPI